MSESDEEQDPSERRAELVRRAVAKDQVFVHSGGLDLLTAVGILIGLFFLPDGGTNAGYAAIELAQLLLGTAAGVFVLRAVARLATYWTS